MPASTKEFLDIQATIECRFTLKCVRDMIRIYSQFMMVSFVKSSIVDVWQGSKYTSELGGLFFALSLRIYLSIGKAVHTAPLLTLLTL